MTDQAIITRCGNGSMEGIWKDTEDCYPLLPRERMTGIVVRDFERSELFLNASEVTPAMRTYTDGTWLDFSKTMDQRDAPRAIQPGAYLVTFEGRRSACSKIDGKLNGYGHMNQYRDFAVIDRLISWKMVADWPDARAGNGS